MPKSVFSHSTLNNQKAFTGSYYRDNRLGLLTKDVAKNFNTYRNWNEFDLTMPKIYDEGDSTVTHPNGKGIKPLFSNVAGVYANYDVRKVFNIPLLDTPSTREEIRKKTDCSIKALVDSSIAGQMGRAIYNYSDFMFCKYLNKIPNNYLITLRKFPLPCSDHINNSCDEETKAKTNKHLPDMGRLITWLGTPGNEMSNILSYSYTIPWQENKAPMEEDPIASMGSNGGGRLGQVLSVLDGSYGKTLKSTNGYGYAPNNENWFANNIMGSRAEGATPANLNLSDSRRIVAERQNAITSVWVPGGRDGGLEFKHEISLTFDYELRSYDGINGRSAMLDLLANILMVTYLQGQFFPGSYRSANMSSSNIYNNLDLFKNKGATSSPQAFMDSLFTSLTQAANRFGFIGEGSNAKEALKKMTSNIFEIMANGLINKIGRPQQLAFSSLISPTPTGQWHLTVGNPKNPILTIGNLILVDSKIEHYGPLGLDDFPTGLRVTVQLKHAKPRDSVAIEQMYMQGNSRIYFPMGERVQAMYDNAKTYKSKSVDKMYNNSGDSTLTVSTDSNDIYKRYFGTTDIQAITLTAKEAFVGGDKRKTSDKNK